MSDFGPPALALARSALAFSRHGLATSTPERTLDYALALVESMHTVAQHCPEPFDDAAEAKLSRFFEVSAGHRIGQGKFVWRTDEEGREFFLRAMTHLASTASRLAREGGTPVTTDILRAAGEKMVEELGPECKVEVSARAASRLSPENQLMLGRDCDRIIAVIRGSL